MAIKDTNRKPFIEDNDTNQFIGIDLPIRKSEGKEGFFASTTTTIEAVKNNIRNLLQTTPGERFFQPSFGVNLRKYSFSQIDNDTLFSIQNEILDKFDFWLPFVQVKDIKINNGERNELLVNVIFNIKSDPNTLASVQINVNNGDDTTDNSTFESGR
jgi:phage baseplate assembly protein W